MKIRILTDEDGNILAFAKAGGVEWQEIDVKDEELDELSADLRHFKLENGRLQKTDSYRISLMEKIKKELSELKTEHSEKEFVYKEKYLQRNRELDKNNLNNIATMMMATKKATFDGWKFKNKDRTDEYVTLTMQDVLELSKIMTEQTTKAMHIETDLRNRLNTMSVEELDNFNPREEFEKLWNI